MAKKKNKNKTNHSPLFDIQVGPGARYFYFLSLVDYEQGAYKNMATIVSNTQKLFQPSEVESQKQVTWNEKLDAIVSLLDEFEKYETNNDKIVFKEAIEPLLKLNPKKFKEFSNIFDNETIDYLQFMTLLTILNTDIETARGLISNLNTVMHNFNQSFNDAIETQRQQREEKNKGSTDPYVIATQQYAQLTKEAYSKMSGQRTSMAAISTDLSNLQDDPNDLLKKATDLAIDALNGGATEQTIQLKNDAVRLELLQQIRLLAATYNKNIIEMLNYITDISNKCASLEDRANLSERDQEVIMNLQKHLYVCLDNLDILEQQYNEINTVINVDIRQRILDSIEDEKDRQKIKRIQNKKDFNIQNIKDFTKYLNALKTVFKEESTNGLLEKLDKSLAQTDTSIRKRKLTATSETRGALDISKLVYSLIAKTVRSGGSGIKTDTKTIGYVKTEEIDTRTTNALIKNIQDKGKNTEKIIETGIRTYNKEEFGERSIKYTTKGDLAAAKKLKEEILENVFQDDLVELEKVSNTLSNIFEIDNSIKFFETFNTTKYGFEGGSMGNIETAIDNINNMLSLGGITPLDAEFLTTAIMNSGAGMLGHGNLNTLEYYLTSVTSLCMFNSGGQALQDWSTAFKARIENLNSSYTGTRKIHLFQLDTIFVPMAYILRLVKEGIMNCAQDLYEHANLKGAQVVIYNPVTEQDKVSKEVTTSSGKKFKVGDWDATAEAGLPKIKIDMALVGGFLDILDEIEQRLNNLLH